MQIGGGGGTQSRLSSRNASETRIQRHVERLAADTSSIFGRSLLLFIECTIEASADPTAVIRNVRQFISGEQTSFVNCRARIILRIEKAKRKSKKYVCRHEEFSRKKWRR